jgi:hypothetical protein
MIARQTAVLTDSFATDRPEPIQEATMTTKTFFCFDCDEPLCEEALQWHDSRCAGCATMDYERSLELETEAPYAVATDARAEARL